MKKIIDKIKNIWNDKSKINTFEIVCLAVILLACFLLFNHGDLLATSSHGRALLDVTLKGKFFSFYDYTKSTAVYSIPIYILFMIWSIPVEIVYKIFSIELWNIFDFSKMGYITMLWYKLLPTIFMFMTGVVLFKIGKLLKMDESKRKWMIFVFLGFPILVFSQYIFGQYDSFNMFFTTLALYFFLQKKYYKFSIMMAIAIPLKLFPIFIFIPLLLLVEKRVFHLAKYLLIGMSGYIISSLLFINSSGFTDASKFSSDMSYRLFSASIPGGNGGISIFIALFILVCVLCYIKKIKDDKEHIYYSLYVMLFVYSIFFMFILWHPQWVLLLVPIWILTMFEFNNIKASFILSIALCMGYIFLTVTCFPNNVDVNLLNRGILPEIFDKVVNPDYSLSRLFGVLPGINQTAFMTLFGGCILGNLILKFPTEKNLSAYKKGYEDKNYLPEKGYIFGLVAVILLFVLPALYLYFK